MQTMVQSMYLLAFYAFLTVGEFTLSHGRIENILQLCQINIHPDARWPSNRVDVLSSLSLLYTPD